MEEDRPRFEDFARENILRKRLVDCGKNVMTYSENHNPAGIEHTYQLSRL